jgi:hypothetical protein
VVSVPVKYIKNVRCPALQRAGLEWAKELGIQATKFTTAHLDKAAELSARGIPDWLIKEVILKSIKK